jgi:hypothetical protein
MRFPAFSLWQLSRRVLSGEVVFFVGAGFSRDSEGNTAERLIFRLLVRFEAMTRQLETVSDKIPHAAAIRTKAAMLRHGLRLTFGLPLGDKTPLATWDHATRLAPNYYVFNDWICSAFSALLENCAAMRSQPEAQELTKVFAGIEDAEKALLQPAGQPRLDPVDLCALDQITGLLDLSGDDRGKALFLETVGFGETQIMTGPGLDKSVDMTPESWQGRVLERHQVLARLAREGLCATTLTTNYDLLLEWAFRLVGLQPSGVEDPRRLLPPTMYQTLVRIAEATDFFGRGGSYRSALIAKIHGCSDVYRFRRTTRDWNTYLPAIVFTFREIQNWREDAWSRDFLRTLLRTRTLVFCGYSGMDPVIHDTFRTVYEEMARKRKATGAEPTSGGAAEAPQSPRLRARRAPAYFLGLEEKIEFHGMEILRAATRALGEVSPDLTDHPNYLRFFRSDQPYFPQMDELMVWLFHLVFRRCQLSAIRSDLRRIATLLLGHPCPESEIEQLRRNFVRVFRAELDAARHWDRRPEHRRQLERITGWTDRFQAGLLRELALGEAVLRNGGPGRDFEALRSCPWYFPALERPDWTAWAAVVEVAVRRMIAAWRGAPEGWMADSDWVRPGRDPHPTILFSAGSYRPTPIELSMRLGFQRIPAPANPRSALRGRTVWQLDPQNIPWTREPRARGSRPGTPPATELWSWAVGDDFTVLDVGRWLGKADEREARSSAA